MLIVCNSGEDPAREHRHLGHARGAAGAGLLITPVSDGPQPRLERFIERGIPVVLVDGARRARAAARSPSTTSSAAGSRRAPARNRGTGISRSSAVRWRSGRWPTGTAAPRGARRIRRRPHHVPTPHLSIGAGRPRPPNWPADLPPRSAPTAVFCANDLLALGVLQGVIGRGSAVPDDLAIVGYDDIEFAAAAAVPLSSVRQPRELLGPDGRRTARPRRSPSTPTRPPHEHRHAVFQPDLIVRRSSER
jgi:LacI family transcriptional regulator